MSAQPRLAALWALLGHPCPGLHAPLALASHMQLLQTLDVPPASSPASTPRPEHSWLISSIITSIHQENASLVPDAGRWCFLRRTDRFHIARIGPPSCSVGGVYKKVLRWRQKKWTVINVIFCHFTSNSFEEATHPPSVREEGESCFHAAKIAAICPEENKGA